MFGHNLLLSSIDFFLLKVCHAVWCQQGHPQLGAPNHVTAATSNLSGHIQKNIQKNENMVASEFLLVLVDWALDGQNNCFSR